MSKYEALSYLLATYFHEDWFEESEGDSWRVVLDFARSEPDTARLLGNDIERVLTSGRSEEDLRQLICDDLASYYRPERDGWSSYGDWLAEVAKRVSYYLRMERTVTCPVCGYPHLTEEPRRPSGTGSREVCPSCAFEFGISDDRQG